MTVKAPFLLYRGISFLRGIYISKAQSELPDHMDPDLGPITLKSNQLRLTITFNLVPGHFARELFRPWVVSPMGRFALGRFAPGCFARELFRPYIVGRFALIF